MDQMHLRNYLLEQHPKDVDTWLQSAIDNPTFSPEDFPWWLGLAQGATFKAETALKTDVSSQDLAVTWARVGVTIYEYLLAQSNNASRRSSLELSLMWLRTFFITKLGAIENDSLLDAKQIIQWFFQDLPYSLQELTKLIEIWQEITRQPNVLKQFFKEKHIIILDHAFHINDIKNMRSVKNKLKIIKALCETEILPPAQYRDLYSWVPLWENLP